MRGWHRPGAPARERCVSIAALGLLSWTYSWSSVAVVSSPPTGWPLNSSTFGLSRATGIRGIRPLRTASRFAVARRFVTCRSFAVLRFFAPVRRLAVVRLFCADRRRGAVRCFGAVRFFGVDRAVAARRLRFAIVTSCKRRTLYQGDVSRQDWLLARRMLLMQ
jgi:hypothetical protein